ESLYLLLTSNARRMLTTVDTVIVDEIHALVPTKRGAHLMLSLERLESLCANRPQRIGLSATQRPLDEVARFLGGAERSSGSGGTGARTRLDTEREIEDEFSARRGLVRFRPVTIVDAGQRKALKLTIEVPVEEMARRPRERRRALRTGGAAHALNPD